MRVRIRLFARLRDIAGASELERDVETDATLGTAWRALTREFRELDRYTGSISGAVNAEYARMDAPLKDGDEVAFLPPVSGGCGSAALARGRERRAGLQVCLSGTHVR
jgi:molybdopterin converting factor subunit 1